MLGERICEWIFLFQEFDFVVEVKTEKHSVGPDHLLRIELGEFGGSLDHELPDA